MTTILITGVNRGIGKALVEGALKRGWSVIGTVRDTETAKQLKEKFGAGFEALVFDVTDAVAVLKAAASLDAPVDILINNAGIYGPDRQSTLNMDFDGFEQTLAVNVLAPLRVVQAFLPHLKRGKNPRVLTISSLMGTMTSSSSNDIAYRTSKAAVNKVMQGLATDLKRKGIAVVSIHPGWVRTDMGGQNADIAPEESAGGILAIAENMTVAGTGRFLNYDGKTLPW